MTRVCLCATKPIRLLKTAIAAAGFVIFFVAQAQAHRADRSAYFDPATVLSTYANDNTNDYADSAPDGAEQDAGSLSGALVGGALNALDYIRENVAPDTLSQMEAKLPRYNRREHFYGWINADPTTNCLDTRTEVLVRDADKRATLVFKSKCTVAKGLWHDPYTGNDFKISTAIQIDHVVPLKHAYLTGAATWTPSRRCTYSNFLGSATHLLAVSGHENMSKGGKGPEGYLPPNEAYVCEYLENWMKIKAIWNLEATRSELNAVEHAVSKYRCSANRFKMSAAQITAARDLTVQAPLRCRQL